MKRRNKAMAKSGLTISLIFEAESANYSEGFGNITVLKKLSRGDGNAYSYISRQALRYNMVNQLGWDDTEVYKDGKGEKSVVQFAPNATIDKYPEIDLFGYMKTKGKTDDTKGGATLRSAVVRLSNAISMEPFKADLDYLTNMGLAKRKGYENSIAQSEIHKSFYTYSLTIDLDRIGVDIDIELDNSERARRVKDFLRTVSMLYRDIKGRRENLSPVFAIGGTYERKNPFFENRLSLDNKKLDLEKILSVLNSFEELKENTLVGYIDNTFANNGDIKEVLNPLTMGNFFQKLSEKVDEYYG
jgi:CRISPR-associated protein Cst2